MSADAFAVLREGACAAQVVDRQNAERRSTWQGRFNTLMTDLLAECRIWLAQAESDARAAENPRGIVHVVATASAQNLRTTIAKIEFYQPLCSPSNGACWQQLKDMLDQCHFSWGVFPWTWLERIEPLVNEFAELFPWATRSTE